MTDDLDQILRVHVTPTAEALRRHFARDRLYGNADFPLSSEAFAVFRQAVTDHLYAAHTMAGWVVRAEDQPTDQLAAACRAEHVGSRTVHGVAQEVYMLHLHAVGLSVPAVLSLPAGDDAAAAVCCFSGHSAHGLKDLVCDLDSYQAGIAVRLAQAGFATVAVEKIDAGYLSRTFDAGVDEPAIASFNLASGTLTRAIQLKACLAAMELLAAHPRTDCRRMGATGVSLGGWLCVESSLFTDRIKAIADFGMKTVFADPAQELAAFQGIRDWCHIVPGLLAICDRNLHGLAAAPVRMLAGHGRADGASDAQGYAAYRDIHSAQYAALGHADHYEYHVHAGGDTMPADKVVAWFRAVL
jgi:dienelactone hydrolase